MNRMILLLCCFLVASGCAPTTPSQVINTTSQDSLMKKQGYVVNDLSETDASDWERETFDLLRKRQTRMRSLKPVPGEGSTYYRFVLTTEIFPTPEAATARLGKMNLKPPDISPEENKAFPLRRAVIHGNQVHILSTDVAMFSAELERLIRLLRNSTDSESPKSQ